MTRDRVIQRYVWPIYKLHIVFSVSLFFILIGCGGGVTTDSNISTTSGGNSGGTSIPSGNASLTLTWSAPSINADGAPLTDLAGYKIYCGLASGNYLKIIKIGNLTSYTVENIAPGTYYLSVTAYNTHNNESDYSDEIIKQAQ